MADAVSYEFEVTATPPERKYKGGTGRPRTNPFDNALLESYKQDFEGQVSEEFPRGKWYRVPGTLTATEVDKVVAQIRSAAHHLRQAVDPNIGSEVNTDKEKGVVAFRGVHRSKSNHEDASDEQADRADNDEPGENPDAETEGEGW
jgi:hypothetical protein